MWGRSEAGKTGKQKRIKWKQRFVNRERKRVDGRERNGKKVSKCIRYKYKFPRTNDHCVCLDGTNEVNSRKRDVSICYGDPASDTKHKTKQNTQCLL